ncbi:MAG: DUF1273 family protein [Clostridia bacterium]|nr:DUF1273 family protein [Clostridia bacterium]
MERAGRDKTCFFTGHRSVSSDSESALVAELDVVLRRLRFDGFTDFVCGGAVGFDTLAACRVAAAARRDPGFRLILVLPCRDQTAMWRKTGDIALYQKLKGLASEIVYVRDFFDDGVMLERNRMMADMSSLCVAYYDGRRSGGTAYTVRYSEKKGIPVVNLFDKVNNIS